MIIKPYTVTKNELIENNYSAYIDIPMYSNILSLKVSGEDIIVFVEQPEQEEVYTTKIMLVGCGTPIDDILQNKRVFHSMITYNEKDYFVYLNEYADSIEALKSSGKIQ